MGFIGKRARTFSGRSRRQGFCDELGRLGLSLHAEADDETTFEGGHRAAMKLFSLADPPDALFCFNDTMAFGALQAAREFKLRVPDDVAIIGFDNQPMAAWPPFELTTVGYDPKALASLATEKILDALEREEIAPGSFHIDPQLIVRRTTP